MDALAHVPVPMRFDARTDTLSVLDQRLLPGEEAFLPVRTSAETAAAIADMAVRGAPAIGIVAAYGVYLGAREAAESCRATGAPYQAFVAAARENAARIAGARPTAVNLRWAVSRMLRKLDEVSAQGSADATQTALDALLREAQAIHAEDERLCRAIGEAFQPLMRDGMTLLTHCNAGQLATSRYGTALAPIYVARDRGLSVRVFADETRPRLQGATLTAYELSRAGVDVTLLCDGMAASRMAAGRVDACIVGADRVARNGDVANKIGTLGVAVAARHFGVPFYVAAPYSTFDPDCFCGDDIPIEERSAEEVVNRFGVRIAPLGVRVENPAFDVTPASLVTAFVTDRGLIYPPYDETLPRALGWQGRSTECGERAHESG